MGTVCPSSTRWGKKSTKSPCIFLELEPFSALLGFQIYILIRVICSAFPPDYYRPNLINRVAPDENIHPDEIAVRALDFGRLPQISHWSNIFAEIRTVNFCDVLTDIHFSPCFLRSGLKLKMESGISPSIYTPRESINGLRRRKMIVLNYDAKNGRVSSCRTLELNARNISGL